MGMTTPDREQALGGCPKLGEVRVFGDKICQFIEREPEGDKWEVVGFVSPPNTVSTDEEVGNE